MAKTKIMIVEKTPDVPEDLGKDLEGMGFDAFTTLSSAEEVFKEVEENRPDLVLMDIDPETDLSAIETAEQIRSRLDTPVLYLVGALNADEKEERKTRMETLDAYILRPAEKRELRDVIEGTLFRHKMERRLENSEARFVTALRSTSDAMITLDSKGDIEMMNHVAQDLTGWYQKESIGRSYKEVFRIVSEETGEEAEDLVANTVQRGAIAGVTDHILLAAKDGREIPIDYSSTPIRDRRGENIGTILIFRDMRQQRQTIHAPAKDVVPKLNSILMGIQAHADLMLTDMYASHPHFEHLKGIEEFVRKAAGLANRLLNPNGGKRYLTDLKDSKTVLFADHDPMVLDAVRPIMEKLGHNVLIAENGKETIEVYKTNQGRVDIVILDMVLPDMGGEEVYRRIREIKEDTRVLITSGGSAGKEVNELLNQGCHSFIQKPFTVENLSQKIREVLEKEDRESIH